MFYKEFSELREPSLNPVLGRPIAVAGSHYSTKRVCGTLESANSSRFLSAETFLCLACFEKGAFDGFQQKNSDGRRGLPLRPS